MCFFVFSSFLASHRGDIRARMGKPRKKHVLQSVFFRFFLLPCLPQGWHQSPYGQTTKKPRFTKCVFSFFPPSLPRHKRPPYVWFFRGFPPLRLGKSTQTQPNLIGGHATNPEETVNQVSSRAFEIKDFHWGEQIVEKRMESKSEYSKHVSF